MMTKRILSWLLSVTMLVSSCAMAEPATWTDLPELPAEAEVVMPPMAEEEPTEEETDAFQPAYVLLKKGARLYASPALTGEGTELAASAVVWAVEDNGQGSLRVAYALEGKVCFAWVSAAAVQEAQPVADADADAVFNGHALQNVVLAAEEAEPTPAPETSE